MYDTHLQFEKLDICAVLAVVEIIKGICSLFIFSGTPPRQPPTTPGCRAGLPPVTAMATVDWATGGQRSLNPTHFLSAPEMFA